MFTPYSFHVCLLITAPAAAFSGLPLYTTRRGNVELLQVQVQVLTSADIPLHVSSGDLVPESTITSTSHWDWLRGWCGASGAYRCPRWGTAVVVLRAEPLITPILTATAGRHALVAAARAVVREGTERGDMALGRLLGAPPGAWGLPGPGSGPQLSSDEPDSMDGWSLPTLPRPSSTSNLCCRPLMTLFSYLISLRAMSSCLWVAVATLALLTISIRAMSSFLCARAATLAMRVISPLPVSTSRSRDWTLLRR